VSGEGKWLWNPTESHYGTPTYAKEQTMLITRDDGRITFLAKRVLADGKKIEWGIDGKFDGKMHKGDWISMSFKRVSPNALSDRYVMADGSMKGGETATISANKIIIRGASTDKTGKKSSYVEVWDRAPKGMREARPDRPPR